MRILLSALAAATVVVPTAAQGDDKFYIPVSLGLYDGDSSDVGLGTPGLFNVPGYMRWQQVCTDSSTRSHPVRWIRVRRDAGADTPLATSRTVDVQVTVGLKRPPTPGQLTGPFTNDFDNNYLPGTKSVLTSRTAMNLPDWSAQPANSPAQFGDSPTGGPEGITFTADNFFFFAGALELVLEIEVWNTGAAGTHAVDATSGTGSFQAAYVDQQNGCGNFQYRFGYPVQNWGQTSQMKIDVTGGTPLGPVIFTVGDLDLNIPLPNFCGNIQTVPAIAPLVGFMDGLGDFSVNLPRGRWNPSALTGARFFTQCASLDAQGCVAMTNGLQNILPVVPGPLVGGTGPEGFLIEHIWSTTPGATTGNGPFSGGLIIEMQDV